MTGHYYIAEVCENGHHTTNRVEDAPERQSKFCPECGKKTFTTCRHCEADIRGDYEVPGVVFLGGDPWGPSNFCYACGKPYPWTEKRLAAAQELTDEIDDLSDDEKNSLKQSLLDLAQDTPRTELASMRYQKISKKLTGPVKSILNKVVTSIATEATKKLLDL